MNFYTIPLPRGWWILLLDFEKNILALQLIYPVNSYTNVWHKSFCQSKKTSRILEIKKFTFSGIFDWFREKLRQSWFHPGDHVSVCFGFSSLLLSSATVLHFCCCCVFTTFNLWWMFVFEVVALVTVVILGIYKSKRSLDKVHYCYIIRRRRCSIVQIESSYDYEDMKVSFLIFGQSMRSAKFEFKKLLSFILM